MTLQSSNELVRLKDAQPRDILKGCLHIKSIVEDSFYAVVAFEVTGCWTNAARRLAKASNGLWTVFKMLSSYYEQIKSRVLRVFWRVANQINVAVESKLLLRRCGCRTLACLVLFAVHWTNSSWERLLLLLSHVHVRNFQISGSWTGSTSRCERTSRLIYASSATESLPIS